MEGLFGMLAGSGLAAALAIIGILSLGFLGANLLIFTIYMAGVLFLFGFSPLFWALVGVPLVILNIPPIRRALITNSLVAILKKLNILPQISETERVALEAGTTWVDKELFISNFMSKNPGSFLR